MVSQEACTDGPTMEPVPSATFKKNSWLLDCVRRSEDLDVPYCAADAEVSQAIHTELHVRHRACVAARKKHNEAPGHVAGSDSDFWLVFCLGG